MKAGKVFRCKACGYDYSGSMELHEDTFKHLAWLAAKHNVNTQEHGCPQCSADAGEPCVAPQVYRCRWTHKIRIEAALVRAGLW